MQHWYISQNMDMNSDSENNYKEISLLNVAFNSENKGPSE